jgi:hypothetical protein
MSRRTLACLTLLGLVAPAPAQGVSSGPAAGEKVPALKVFDATGENADKDVDYAAARKGQPTVYLFVRADKFDRPMNRFLRALDGAVQKDFPDVYVVAVWLTDDAAKTKELLPRVQQSVGFGATALTCYAGGAEGPKGWGVNADAHLTAVLANKGKVAATFGYPSLNETDVPAVRDALKKMRGAK